ncbi:MAG: cytochrome c nitrite reductase small subunit [Prolixibacteraceae bacterium]|jgi:cytochrome c nitrite reductase small subunit|nr:cytochrome c nitrite reductase small subunit [Prolixibacteraceae bacterium]NLX28895.1 cytochrome c nitrite reductase small subunit [Bacteroidales bacterium]HOY53009.1 cytochrome c nitrite reductase small subunit [Prolixibacteraceae bacterium]HPJ78274.1 cytochrome c nitrite reductase small subunit [Prolixibacteraceae bacterium]HRV89716.1 cytochrome c nitrite reductase small subunit [Prolixibacteraceae bacterium]
MFRRFLPPPQWRFPVLILAGIFTGLGLFSVYLGKAHLYLSDRPEACVNCHIMAPQYATWNHSSHREKAHCNDCHVPHNNVFNKYYFKANDGLRHSTLFTLRMERQVIRILEPGARVVHNNCIRCHEQLLVDPKLEASVAMYRGVREGRRCIECHREVPHGKVNSLSSVPYARVPLLESPVPEWLRKNSKEN